MPKPVSISKAELLHIMKALDEYRWWIDNYPENIYDDALEGLAVAEEIIKGKLNEF